MENFSQEPVTINDLPFIMEEFEAGSKTGNFSKEFLDPKKGKILEKQLREMIYVGETGKYTGHFFYTLTRTSDKQRIGFIWLKVAPDPAMQSALEIRAVCINKNFRGKGYASIMLDEWLQSYPQHPFQAKCYPRSTQMIEMLKRRGFYVFDTAASGNTFLVRNRMNAT
jgi:ribosomal protein S18 acetylase RimI-like enzyme